ncbi:hypothetical protein [Gordonia sp. FQ]|uniref:hypothetical protein n=1 Tax=Gordonia sp. FQ TaxID=3446634 RepID=UPI003F824B33
MIKALRTLVMTIAGIVLGGLVLKWSETGALGRGWGRAVEAVDGRAEAVAATVFLAGIAALGLWGVDYAVRHLDAARSLNYREWAVTRQHWGELAFSSFVIAASAGALFLIYA